MTTPNEIRDRLRSYALTLPEAHEAGPWGESVVKVRNKIFLFLGTDSEPNPGFGVKLPESHEEAFALPSRRATGQWRRNASPRPWMPRTALASTHPHPPGSDT